MMQSMDPRAAALAQILVHRSLDVKQGDKLVLGCSDFVPSELLRECYRVALQAGALVELDIGGLQLREAAGLSRVFFETANDDQLTRVSEITKAKIGWGEKFLLISHVDDELYLQGVPPKRLGKARMARVPVSEELMQKRWLATQYPGYAMAKNAGMTLEECIDLYYAASLLDYDALTARIKALQDILDAGSIVRVIGPGTDLKLGIEGRLAAGAVVGRRNVPDGESFLAPLETQTNGIIQFELPQIRDGHEIEGIRLEFKDGAIVSASAKTGDAFLQQVLNEHEGNRRLGELGIGMNPLITKYMKNLLFDEKIQGTVHFALGRAYSEERGGGKNWGTVHWDLVKDLRMPGTSVTVDDRVIIKDGVVLV